ncbi:hypothetical protein [Rothia sp. CCM 9418]|uniref:hypothetical protein n=1 Tax=unclassified Rothia (in: high G+C Gram-positive bacteria) TaxID=2689056 RepID=UPI003ACE0A12
MNLKDFSPAFLTSLAGIFVGALMIGSSSVVVTALGWLLLLAALVLNVFSVMVSLQGAKGKDLPSLISSVVSDSRGDEKKAITQTEDSEPEPDTEAQPTVEKNTEKEQEKIFRTRSARPRN